MKDVKLVRYISGNSKGTFLFFLTQGYGYVTFENEKSYEEALKLNRKEF